MDDAAHTPAAPAGRRGRYAAVAVLAAVAIGSGFALELPWGPGGTEAVILAGFLVAVISGVALLLRATGRR